MQKLKTERSRLKAVMAGFLDKNGYAYVKFRYPQIDAVLMELIRDTELKTAMQAGKRRAFKRAFELIGNETNLDGAVSAFSAHHYLKCNPDVAGSRHKPLVHYLLYGRPEGRPTLEKLRATNRHFGKQMVDCSKPTVMIVVRSLTKSNVTYQLREIIREANIHANVVLVALEEGQLREKMLEDCCELIVTGRPNQELEFLISEKFEKPKFALVLSVDAQLALLYLVAKEIPFATYVQTPIERVNWFYSGLNAALFSDRLIFASEQILQNWKPLLSDIQYNIERDAVVAKLPLQLPALSKSVEKFDALKMIARVLRMRISDETIVCGGGSANWRNGTDVFMAAAENLRKKSNRHIFFWIGNRPDPFDQNCGVYLENQAITIRADMPDGNVFFVPDGPLALDVLRASDIFFLSGRIDPERHVADQAEQLGLPFVVNSACSEFYSGEAYLTSKYNDPADAARIIKDTPQAEVRTKMDPQTSTVFRQISSAIDSIDIDLPPADVEDGEFDVPMLFSPEPKDTNLRKLERRKVFRYERRFVWRSVAEAERALNSSSNLADRLSAIVPYAKLSMGTVPDFGLHMHAFYIDDVAEELKKYCLIRHAKQIIITTDTQQKSSVLKRILREADLNGRVITIPNQGRDILPFLRLFRERLIDDDLDIWCHLHQKRSLQSPRDGRIWHRYLTRILLGSDQEFSAAISQVSKPSIGLVAPFDPFNPHAVSWSRTHTLLDRHSSQHQEDIRENTVLFPLGNMFWIKRAVVDRMNRLFDDSYPWTNEPLPIDGTEYHLIERLWPAIAAECNLKSLFIYKMDEKRI